MDDMLRKGDALPHFDATSLAGGRITYSALWQRKHLVLLTAGANETAAASRYLAALAAAATDEDAEDTAIVATTDLITGLPRPGLIVADRWGEIQHVAHADRVDGLPTPVDVAEWIAYVRRRCPECEGEAR
jgi:hypothetical protein